MRSAPRPDERLERERRAPDRLAEGRRLAEGFVQGGRVRFRTTVVRHPKTGNVLQLHEQYFTEWQEGSIAKVVTDAHVRCAYGVAFLEVKPDGPIPGLYLMRGQLYTIPLRSDQYRSAGVYKTVEILM